MPLHEDYCQLMALQSYGKVLQVLEHLDKLLGLEEHDCDAEHDHDCGDGDTPPEQAALVGLDEEMLDLIEDTIYPELLQGIADFDKAYEVFGPASDESQEMQGKLLTLADRALMAASGSLPSPDTDISNL